MKPAVKKFSLIALTLTSLLAMAACAKKVQKSPLETADPKVDSPADVDASKAREQANQNPLTMVGKANPDALPEGASRASKTNVSSLAMLGSYQGSIVTLAVPSAKNWGSIRISDEDAKALYQALRIKTTATQKNQNYLEGTAKTGHGIRCYKGAEVKTPTAEEYSCSIYFDYVTGTVNEMSKKVEFDETVPAISEKFSGQSVIIDPSAKVPTAFIRVTGLDAQAMYTLLRTKGQFNADADQTDITAMERKGKNITCVKSRPSGATEDSYKCMLSLNALSGAIAMTEEAPTFTGSVPLL